MNAPVPFIPENAPFTPEQRAYLNGFFAGLFSRAGVAPGTESGRPNALRPLTILFGSQTGNAETLARRIAKESSRREFAPAVHDLGNYQLKQLAAEERLLVVTSTYGDGEPPDNAKAFWQALSSDATPRLEQTRFALLALGDTNYPKFCAFGKELDARLEALGGQRIEPRVDCDLDYEEPFAKWLEAVLAKLAEGASSPRPAGAIEVLGAGAPVDSNQSAAAPSGRSNPFPALLLANRKLNGPDSAKDTRHFEFLLEGSGLSYEAGDALGVIPTNCPGLVEELMRLLQFRPEEPVPGRSGTAVPVKEALLGHYEITKISQPFLRAMAERSGDAALKRLAAPGVNGELTTFLWGREIVDLLIAYPAARFSAAEFIGLLKKLQPRLYSISSSPKAHAGQVHLTVGILRYESLGRPRKGVCSTFLAERAGVEHTVPVFVQASKHFRPPPPDRAMIMVGPGTGVAPFRAFLHERRESGASGRNWLFFGDQRSASDFLYRTELEEMLQGGTLQWLETAFSRDQAGKFYVQHRMIEHATELFRWIEEGAHFYVCGDASRMAKDVDKALHQVIEMGGQQTAEQAAEYVRRLQAEKRYQRDVY